MSFQKTHTDLGKQIQPIYLSHAQVYIFDSKNWTPLQETPVPTSIMYDATRGIYRLISVDISCKHVIINSTIQGELEFHKTSQRFGHWTDQATGSVYGIGFKDEKQLEDFADCVKKAKAAIKATAQQLSAKCSTTKDPLEVLLPPPEDRLMEIESLRIKPPSIKPLTYLFGCCEKLPEQPSIQEFIQKCTDILPESEISSEISKLREENLLLKTELQESVKHSSSWAVGLESLRLQNEELVKAMHLLGEQIDLKKRESCEIQQECGKLKEVYLSGSQMLGGNGVTTEMEGKYRLLLQEKGRLEKLIGNYESVEKLDQAGQMEKYYTDLLAKAERMLSQALKEDKEGKETVQSLEGVFTQAIKELGIVHEQIRGLTLRS